MSNLELKRLKYIENKKTKLHENDILDKLNSFRKKLNSESVIKDDNHWMNNKLSFHIDSIKAFSH